MHGMENLKLKNLKIVHSVMTLLIMKSCRHQNSHQHCSSQDILPTPTKVWSKKKRVNIKLRCRLLIRGLKRLRTRIGKHP